MKLRLIIPAAAALCLLFSGCHKICNCNGYDFIVYSYTAEEVDEYADGNCTNMRDFPIANHYSICRWD